MNSIAPNRFDTIVIGGGQSGLAAGYHLNRAGRSFLIVDANQRSGDTWRGRWDSLRLFSPAQYDSLPGLPLVMRKGTFPGKDVLADYLEGYARHFNFPILRGVRVTRVARQDTDFLVECGVRAFSCANVIVATGAYSRPQIPDSSALLSPAIQQVHSSGYRRPEDVVGDRVLVVGFGTSGIEIAIELAAAGRRVLLSGRPTAQALSKFVPAIFAGKNPILRLFGAAYWNFIHRVVTIDTTIGRKAKSQISLRGQPLIRLNRGDAVAAGVEHVARLAGVTEGKPCLEDGRGVDVSAVVWCTGFRPNYEFLELPNCPFDVKGLPVAPHGIVGQIPGLYFVGLPFQVGLTSTLVGGADRDAALVVRHIAQQRNAVATGCTAQPQTGKPEASARLGRFCAFDHFCTRAKSRSTFCFSAFTRANGRQNLANYEDVAKDGPHQPSRARAHGRGQPVGDVLVSITSAGRTPWNGRLHCRKLCRSAYAALRELGRRFVRNP